MDKNQVRKKRKKEIKVKFIFLSLFLLFIGTLLAEAKDGTTQTVSINPVGKFGADFFKGNEYIGTSINIGGNDVFIPKSSSVFISEPIKISLVVNGQSKTFTFKEGDFFYYNNRIYRLTLGKEPEVDEIICEGDLGEKVKKQLLGQLEKGGLVLGNQLEGVKYSLSSITNVNGEQIQVVVEFDKNNNKLNIIPESKVWPEIKSLKYTLPGDLTKIVSEQLGIPEEVASVQVQGYTNFWSGLVGEAGKDGFYTFTLPSKTALIGYRVLGGFEQFVRIFPGGRFYGSVVGFFKNWWVAGPAGAEGAVKKVLKWGENEGGGLTITRTIWIYLSDIAASKFAIDLANDAGEAKAEVPLKGTKWCELCNWDNYSVCTEERCRMLGQCVYKSVLPDPRGGICLPAACTEGYPKITSMNVSFHIDETHVDKTVQSSNCPGGKGECALEEKGGNPIEISYNVSYAVISIATQQYAECRYIVDKKGANFSEMNTIEGDLYMPKTRTFKLDVARLEPGRTHVVYIKCASTCNEHPPGFDYNYIKFKIGEKPDFLPPNIVMVDPDDKTQYVSDRLGTITIRLWLDENGTCRYSTKREGLSKEWKEQTCQEANESSNGTMCEWGVGKDWTIKNDTQTINIGKFVIKADCTSNQPCRYKDAMGQVHYYNKSTCTMCNITINASDVFADVYNWTQMGEDIGRFAESCKENPSTTGCAEFTQYVLNKGIDISRIKDMGVNKLFSLNFRCADDKGNVMPIDETYEYRLFTFPEYNISIESPTPGFSTYEKYVDMRVVSDRPTECRFSYNKTVVPLPTGATGKGYVETDFNKMQKIDDVFATEHKGRIENLARGNYILLVKCRDAGGMEKAANTTFTIGQAPMPKVIRISVEGNDLKIETDVKAKCIYSIDEAKGCNFVEGIEVRTTAGVTVQKQAQDMASMNALNHISTYVPEWTYYIKCKDAWGDNAYPSNCTAIIKPFELVQSVSSA